MKFAIKGSLEIRIPDDCSYTIEADSKEEAIEELVKQIISDGELNDYVSTSYLRIKSVKKTFKVTLSQRFENTIYLDTDEYPDIENEDDAARYVEDNIEDFRDQCEYDDCTEEAYDATCYERDTIEEEEDFYE